MCRIFIGTMAGWLIALGWPGRLAAGPIFVPNASFESPLTSFVSGNISVSVNIDYWQKSPQPAWYTDGDSFPWADETGIFKNTPTNSPDHIDNINGTAAMWLFAVPTVGVFQDYNTTDANHSAPTHNFNATFDAGQSYQLAVGVIGGGGGMLPGETMDISLYYRDNSNNMVTVGDTTITNDPSTFLTTTHFVNFLLTVPTVKPSDAWAGKNIGIQLASTVSPTVSTNDEGGYWDLDNVRLTSFVSPTIISPVWTNRQFQFTLQSDPGVGIEILATTNAMLALSNWTSLGMVTNQTGALQFADTNANAGRRFYQARQVK